MRNKQLERRHLLDSASISTLLRQTGSCSLRLYTAKRQASTTQGSVSSNGWLYSLVEMLEPRNLFSVTLTDYGLDILGTDNDDTIVVRMDDDGKSVHATVNGVDSGPFDLSELEPGLDDIAIYISAQGLGGNDHIWVDESNGMPEYPVTFIGGYGNDTLAGGLETSHIVGDDGNDDISTGGNAEPYTSVSGVLDRAFGNGGNDTIRGGEGGDYVWGGDGDDTFADSESLERLKGGPGTDAVDGISLERVTVIGTSGDDEIIISVSDNGEEVVVTLNGDEVETLENHRAHRLLLLGGDGDDTIEIVNASEFGLLFDITRLRGGDGNDTISAGEESVTNGSFSPIRIHGDAGADVLTGTQEDDLLFGGSGADVIHGGDGGDWIRGGKDNDTVDGQDGDDSVFGLTGNDTLAGGDGNDYIEGNAGDDRLDGGAGNDQLEGRDGDDRLEGGAGNDQLTGHDGSDSLFGNDGDDVLIGHRRWHANDPGDVFDVGSGQDTILGDDEDEIDA